MTPLHSRESLRSQGSSEHKFPASQPLVSIVIISYNYEKYIGIAIASALEQTYSRTEIIVVDDGSTDRSWDIILGFRDKLKSSLKKRGGETSTNNAGFALSSGDVVMFLDSDDVLHPRAAEELAKRWRPGTAKIQFRLAVIDGEGAPIGAVIPGSSRKTPEAIRRSVRCTGMYSWPPTTGNGYARWFLEQCMPLSGAEFPSAPDGVLNAVAPLYGDVLVIDQVLGYYRVHGTNAFGARRLDPERIRRELAMRVREMNYFLACAARLGSALERSPFDSMLFLERRLTLLRFAPSLGWPGDSKSRLLLLASRTLAIADRSPFGRALLFVSFLTIAVAPPRLARRVAELRLVPGARPRLLSNVLRRLARKIHRGRLSLACNGE